MKTTAFIVATVFMLNFNAFAAPLAPLTDAAIVAAPRGLANAGAAAATAAKSLRLRR